MKNLFITLAKYNAESDAALASILGKLTNEEREKERGSYYKSLSGLARHILGGTIFFAGMFKSALARNEAALKALEPMAELAIPKGALTEAQWKETAAAIDTADKALVAMIEALREEDFNALVPVPFYGGNPAAAPMHFMLHNLIAHNIHHRGQASQILDELKIDNDYSGINVAFLA